MQHFQVPVHRLGFAVIGLGAFHKVARVHQAQLESKHGGPNRRDDTQPVDCECGKHFVDVRAVKEALPASRGNGINVLCLRHT